MNNYKKFTIIFLFLVLLLPVVTLAQNSNLDPSKTEGVGGSLNIPPDSFYKAQVIDIPDSNAIGPEGNKQVFQSLSVKILDGNEKGQVVRIDNVGGAYVNGGHSFVVGDKVVINKTTLNGETTYYVQDTYRIPPIIILTVIFIGVALLFSRWKGFSSLIGLGISILTIVKFVAPQIIAGHNPLLMSLAGTVIIAFTSLYLAHGFNKRTSIALLSTLITLVLAVGLAYFSVHGSRLYGNGSEESVFLQIDQTHHIDLQGLLLGGIILGALGVLDDITTGQAATVDELKKANPKLGFKRLYQGGISVGKEHIASLINTLFLAYAGASMPLFLLLVVNSSSPVWTTINSEFIAEEVVRSLVGSITLIVAVPITTVLAAYFFRNAPSNAEDDLPDFVENKVPHQH